MTTRQTQGAGVVLLCVLAAILVSGAARHYLEPARAAGEQSQPRAAADTELRGDPPTRVIEIPAGFRLEQVTTIVGAALGTSSGRFLALVRSPQQARQQGIDAPSLEGYLAPGTYELPLGVTEEGLLAEMVGRFHAGVTPAMRRRARELRLTIPGVVTLASIVQREAMYASDMPAIAGVFLNRLRLGMRLESDPTVQYAIETAEGVPDAGRYWTTDLSHTDLGFPSRFNTYARKGLPPAPINSPSMAAINAVLYPARVPYLYFVGKKNGASAFATTLDEHRRNIALHLRGRSRSTSTGLQGMLERLAQGIDGHVGFVVKNLATGETASVNAGDFFTTASLYKLFVLDAAFERRAHGKLSFDRGLPIPTAAARLDPPAVRARLGAEPTVTQALLNMIVVSSNGAGVTLLRSLGKPDVTRFVHAQGLRDTFLTDARFVSTPRDVARLLELIALGRAVSPKASRAMRTMLLRQELNAGLPRYLPRGTPVAHKTGSLAHVSHDAGIVYTSHGPIVVVALTEGVPDPRAATKAIARLAQFVLYYFERYRPAAQRFAAAGNPACAENPFRPTAQGTLSGRTIVLDPGHGGSLPGATYRFADGFVLTEKAVNLDAALRLKELLTARGATVYLTRCHDVRLPVIDRPAFANGVGADLSVSIHVNKSPNPAKDGTELYYLSRDGHVLANYVMGSFTLPALWQTLSAGLALPNGGVHQREFDVLVYADAPAVLSESVFMSHPAEADALRAASGWRREQIARGHLRGILGYFGGKRWQVQGAPQRATSPSTGGAVSASSDVARLSPRQKAALLVVSGLPAPEGVAGVIVGRWDRAAPRPPGALVFADQEGGRVRAFADLPPSRPASSYTSSAQAFASARRTAAALRRAGVQVDFAPVLDAKSGPLGSRHFASGQFALAFARGLAAGGVGACVKHFPGLGSTIVSSDIVQGHGELRRSELARFTAAVRSGVPCVMVANAIYPTLGPRPASLEPATYLLLRRTGFHGVIVTDALDVLGGSSAPRWARLAVEAGADLVLFHNPSAARQAIDALVPLARRGELDESVARVLRLRRLLGG